MKKISLIVSTTDLNFLKNPYFFENINFDLCQVVVVQQLIHSDQKLVLENKHVELLSVKEKGLSKSRNRGLSLAKCSIAVICDDDIQFIKGFEDKILKAYSKHKDASLISFKIEDKSGTPYKKYSDHAYKHNLRTTLRVNSMGITLNLDKFENKKLFNENFGLGADYCPTGEDTIFAAKTYFDKRNCYFEPYSIIIHPLESSGKNFNASYPINLAKVYKEAFGLLLGLFLGFIFSIKKYNLYKKELGFFEFNVNFIKGFLM